MAKIDIKSGVILAGKIILPTLKKIIKSAISKIGKQSYDKLYNRFCDGLASFETALSKCLNTTDVNKLEKHITLAKIGLGFYEQMHTTLDSMLPDYNAIILEASERLENLKNGVPAENEGE